VTSPVALSSCDWMVANLACGLVVEVKAAVDAPVGAFLVLYGPGAHKAQGPPLELPGIRGGEVFGIRDRDRLTDNAGD
jgi:hypothetical protein